MAVLIIFALNDGQMVGYDAGDVITVYPADKKPGRAFMENNPPRVGFLYVDNVDHDDPGLLELTEQHIIDDELAPDGKRYVGKRVRTLNLNLLKVDATHRTYRAHTNQLAAKVTRSQLTPVVRVKPRAVLSGGRGR